MSTISERIIPQDVERIKSEAEFCKTFDNPIYFQPEKIDGETERDYWWRVQDSVLDFLIQAVENDTTGKVVEKIAQFDLNNYVNPV